MQVVQAFYEGLFKEQGTEEEYKERFLEAPGPALGAEAAGQLAAPLSIEEVWQALRTGKKYKTPGGDGLPYEWYVAMWDVLGEDLVAVFRECLEEGLSPSMRKGLEMWARAVRADAQIRGLPLPGAGGAQFKYALYMDDVTVFCSDQPSVDRLVRVCGWFGKATSARLNMVKSEALILGGLAEQWRVPFVIQPEMIKVLGPGGTGWPSYRGSWGYGQGGQLTYWAEPWC
ncbi:hypothetical protein AAFF_G00367650 [Aldrovandia affinis]|uniref:Reverse transcriptase domain-containing protein n=1 Tax=Aldrovandia affinis TaxID=143900 RepID=A0AAD7R542_9TELE|nr:hypothetical protein AAFF_G00367650 [Aldrovandia affinis]